MQNRWKVRPILLRTKSLVLKKDCSHNELSLKIWWEEKKLQSQNKVQAPSKLKPPSGISNGDDFGATVGTITNDSTEEEQNTERISADTLTI